MAASYPGSVKSYTTKNTNDVIEASHVNDLQLEVTAVEDALVGTARIAHDLLFTDATYDIGKTGATRPRDFFLSRNATIGGTLAVTGVATMTAQTVFSAGATFAGNLIATDNLYDIGASGATRFRDLFLGRNASIVGTLTVTGNTTLNALVDISGASAGQLKFPASQNASTNANTLDDYEEGTWTPADGSGASLSLTITSAQYIKIGQLVWVQADITYPATGNGSGAIISGLPFTNQATNGGGGAPCFSNATFAYQLMVQSSATTIYISKSISATQVVNSDLSTLIVRFSLVYRCTA